MTAQNPLDFSPAHRRTALGLLNPVKITPKIGNLRRRRDIQNGNFKAKSPSPVPSPTQKVPTTPFSRRNLYSATAPFHIPPAITKFAWQRLSLEASFKAYVGEAL